MRLWLRTLLILALLQSLMLQGVVVASTATADITTASEPARCMEMIGQTDQMDDASGELHCCEQCVDALCSISCGQAATAVPENRQTLPGLVSQEVLQRALRCRTRPPFDSPLIRPPAIS